MTALPLLVAWVGGWLIVSALAKPAGKSVTAQWLLNLSLGFALGTGTTATLHFVLLTTGLGPLPSAVVSDLLLLALGGVLRWRKRRETPAEGAPPPRFKWAWPGGAGLILALAFLTGSMVQTARTMPYGDWDAWAIWNMRAKFLASDNWQGSISKEIGVRSHPEYPLLWPGAVAKTWSWTGSTGSPATPAFLSALASLALAAILLSGVWLLRGAAMGAMAALVLVASVSYWQYAALQYADIPLAMFMLAALCVAVIAETQQWRPGLMALSGILASLAAWTKDEGAVLLVGLGVTVLVRARRRALAWLAAALPATLLVAVFKLVLTPGSPIWGAPKGDFAGRMKLISGVFFNEILGTGHFPAHPVLMLILCAALLGLRRPARPIWPLAPVAILGASYIGAYMVTNADLSWHLQTSATRLLLQITPSFLFCLFLLLRSPIDGEPAKQEMKRKR